jgi:hypothetical protein
VAQTAQEQVLALDAMYYDLFTGPAGPEVLADLKARACYGKTTLTSPAPGQPIDMAYVAWQEGRRSLVLEILAKMEVGRRGLLPQQQALRGAKDQDG